MSLVRIGDTVLLSYKGIWCVWEPAWEQYRPITSLAWDGDRIVLDDRAFCRDPTDSLYGYGDPRRKDLCRLLTQMYPPASAQPGPLPAAGSTPEWFYDRYLCLTPCAPRDRASWKRFHKGKYRTPRTAPKTRLTRRQRA